MEYDENIVEVSEAKIADTTNWMDNLDSFPKITTIMMIALINLYHIQE